LSSPLLTIHFLPVIQSLKNASPNQSHALYRDDERYNRRQIEGNASQAEDNADEGPNEASSENHAKGRQNSRMCGEVYGSNGVKAEFFTHVALGADECPLAAWRTLRNAPGAVGLTRQTESLSEAGDETSARQ
jgi:hypothetical protein